MKRQLLIGIIALTSAPAFAAFINAQESTYIGASYSNNNSSNYDIDNANGYNFYAGAAAFYLGAEVGYSNLGSNDNGSDYSLGYMSLNYVTMEDNTDFGVRLRLGASYYDIDGVDSDSGVGFLYGAGVEYKLTDQLFGYEDKELTLGLDYTNYHLGGDTIGQWALTSRIYFR